MKLYEFSIKKPVLVSIALITLLVMGGVSVYKLPIEFFPHMDFPFIGVYVPYPNSLPSYVEKNIAKPLEEILGTLGNVRKVFSQSYSEGAFVGVNFNWGQDVNVLRMEVKEKVDQIRNELPNDIERIQIFTFDSNDAPIMVGRISAKGKDLSGSYDLLERTILNPLRRIDGVGQVNIDGITPKEVSIYLKLDRLKAHRVDVGKLFGTLQDANLSAAVGEITSRGLRYSVRALGNFSSFDEIENMVINEEGLRLKDVAEVYYGEPVISYGRHLDGEKAIAFWVQKSSGANTVEVARRVKTALEKVNNNPAMEGINVLLFWDQSEQILNSLSGLKQAGLIGSLFAISILYFFLRRLTTTLIITIAIPYSLLCTCAFLYFTGRSLNILTMMGLMLGVGMLVDNAIVVLESIFRHQSAGEDSVRASLVGSREVATAVLAATSTSIIVFAPVIFTSDSTGLLTFLAQVGITISVSLIFSLLVSLTLIPFLTSRILSPKQARRSELLLRIQDKYLSALRWTTMRRPYLTGFVIVPLVVVMTAVGAKVFKLGFDMQEGDLIENLYISYEFSDNLSYSQTEKYVDKVEEFLFSHKDELGVETVYSYFADNEAATTIFFKDKYLSKKKLRKIREKLHDNLPEMAGAKLHLGDEKGERSAGAKTMQVTLFGEDEGLLEELALEVKRRFLLLGKLEDVRTSIESGKEEIKVSMDRQVTARYGIDPETIGGVMNLTFRGVPLRRFQAKSHEVRMSVILDPEDRIGLYNLKNLIVGYKDDKELTLGAAADFSIKRGPNVIRRENQKTAVSIRGSYDEDKSKEIKESVTAVMNSIELPMGYSWSFGDKILEKEKQQQEMIFNALLALICVYMVMAALFESFLHPFVIMFCLPFAFVGVVWMMIITRTAVSLMGMIGLVILIGIVVNNGIVLIDHVNNFRKRGSSLCDAIIEGGRERFRPILMTAATTILGLTPMAVGHSNIAGSQYYPLARAVMGGLLSSTVLTLLVLPTYYVIAENFVRRLSGVWVLSEGLEKAAEIKGKA